jgi:mono/diheme cytochrome c family protein
MIGFLHLLFGVTTSALIAGAAAGTGSIPSQDDPQSGAYLYRVFCVVCHGESGKGNGPVADALHPAPTDLTVLARRAGGTFPRERVLEAIQIGGPTAAHVPGGMPSWSEAFARLEPSRVNAEKRIRALLDHVESLQEKDGAPVAMPPASSAARLSAPDGRALFLEHCASCHGASARGDGPVASSLRNFPGDLTQFAKRNGGVFPSARVHRIIEGRDVGAHGSGEMPVWGHVFRRPPSGTSDGSPAERIDAIVRYLESIQERDGHDDAAAGR